MQMRRPVTVLMRLSEMRHAFPFLNNSSVFDRLNICKAQVAIQGIKAKSIERMMQNKCGAVVTILIIEGKTMNGTVHKCIDRCAWFAPDIGAQVQASRLLAG